MDSYLNGIKEFCINQETCHYCPFYKTGCTLIVQNNMKPYDVKEITEIKNKSELVLFCKNMLFCNFCPFNYKGLCKISDIKGIIPCEWDLEYEE